MRQTAVRNTLLCLSALFILIGCASQTTNYEETTSTKRSTGEVLFTDGEITMLATNTVTIRTENGMEYCFAMDENTELGEEELAVGITVTISYSTDGENSMLALSVIENEQLDQNA